MSKLREAIRRALFDSMEKQTKGTTGQVATFYVYENLPPHLQRLLDDQTDAVLEVLSDPPDSV